MGVVRSRTLRTLPVDCYFEHRASRIPISCIPVHLQASPCTFKHLLLTQSVDTGHHLATACASSFRSLLFWAHKQRALESPSNQTKTAYNTCDATNKLLSTAATHATQQINSSRQQQYYIAVTGTQQRKHMGEATAKNTQSEGKCCQILRCAWYCSK